MRNLMLPLTKSWRSALGLFGVSAKPKLHEIERGFLVDARDAVAYAAKHRGEPLVNGYLTNDPGRAVRVRIAEGTGYLTVKGPKHGASCIEVERAISLPEAEALMTLTLGNPVRKMRHRVPLSGGLFVDLDVFAAPFDGLVKAEVELPSSDHPFAIPEWFGPEVTNDPRYANQSLAFTKEPPPIYVRERGA